MSTTNGELLGTKEKFGIFESYFSFKGIPYAKPPVGDLRFRNPVEHEGWQRVRDASKHGSSCTCKDFFEIEAEGEEDCLFLNVYSPDLDDKLPVMFWIHGGSFTVSVFRSHGLKWFIWKLTFSVGLMRLFQFCN